MQILRLSHLRSPLLAALCAAVSLALLDVAMEASFGSQPAWLAASMDSSILSSFGGRLARAEQLQRAGVVERNRLIAVTGLSPVREDLDPAILKAADPAQRDWLVLGAQGRTFATLEVYVRALADSGVRPSIVVLGITPAMLHRDDHAVPLDAGPSKLLRHLKHRQIYHAALDVSWLYRNGDALADGTTVALYDAARDVRRVFDLPMSATYEPERNPWSSWTSVFESRSDAAHMEAQWAGHRQLLAPEQFESVGRQVAAWRTIVRRLRGNGAEVICVLMPETTRLRAIEPPIVAERFAEALNEVGDGQPLRVIDLRDAIPDEMFWDDAHLNPRGRRMISSELPGLVR